MLELHGLARRVIAESYSQPDHGPLGTDGEPDHPTEENVVMHASKDEEWPFSVSASVLLERVARGDLVKVQGPTGWIGLVSKETMAKEPGKYVPVTEKQQAPAEQGAAPEVPKKSEGLVELMTAERVRRDAFQGPREWTDKKPANLPEETWTEHFDGHPWYGKCTAGHAMLRPSSRCPHCGREVVPAEVKPERAALHEKIIAARFDHVPPVAPGEQKIAIMTMGGPASGKTTMLQGIDKRNFVQIDPDHIKDDIPEFVEGTNPAMTWEGTAHCVHKESTYIGDVLQERAMRAGKHMVIDGTGADVDSFLATMQKLKARGYRIKLVMPDLDIETGLKRVHQRAQQSGRFVPDKVIRDAYEMVPRNFERLARQADEAKMFDARRPIPSADGKTRPRLVWSLDQKKGEQRHDKAFIEQFLARASGGSAEAQPRRQPAAA